MNPETREQVEKVAELASANDAALLDVAIDAAIAKESKT